MSKSKRITLIYFITLSFIISLCSNVLAYGIPSSAQNDFFPEDYIGYQYPIYPGTDKWDLLKTHQDKVDACQIPEDELVNMTTAELIETILAYPLLVDMFVYDNLSIGYSIVSQHFNGLAELEKRQDATAELISVYTQSDPANILTSIYQAEQTRVVPNSNKIIDVLALSAILGQSTYRENLNAQDNVELASLFTTITTQESFNHYNSRSTSSVYPIQFYGYTRYGGIEDEVLTPEDSLVDAYYNSSCAEVWVYSDYSLRVVNVYSEIPTAYASSLNEEAEATYGLTPERQPTIKYNCHSYAWHSTLASNKYWMDYPSYFITDGSYEEVEKLDAEVGGRIVYYFSYNGTYTTPSHSAIITDIEELPRGKRNFTLISKWGPGGLYEHTWENCPYYYVNNTPVDLKYFN